MLPNKRITDYVVSAAARWIDQLGHSSVKIRSDNNMVREMIGDRIQIARVGRTTIMLPSEQRHPAYQSRKGVEDFVKNMVCQTRVMIFEIGLRNACTVTCQHAIFPWLVRAVGYLWTHLHMDVTGHSTTYGVLQEDVRQQILPFGETVLFRSGYNGCKTCCS